MGYLSGPLVAHASLRHVDMHTDGCSKHARHAAPARHQRLRALVCAAAGLQSVRGQETTTWSAEGMSESSAAVVRTGSGAAMGAMAGMSRQQRFGARSTHCINIRGQRQLLRSGRWKQNPAACSQEIPRPQRSKGKAADMAGRFFLAGDHGRLTLLASRLTPLHTSSSLSIAPQKCNSRVPGSVKRN